MANEELKTLVFRLWNFIENDGGTTEFFILREQVRGLK